MGLFFAHPTGTFDLTGEQGLFVPSPETPTRDIFVLLADTPSELMGAWQTSQDIRTCPALGVGLSPVASYLGKPCGGVGRM